MTLNFLQYWWKSTLEDRAFIDQSSMAFNRYFLSVKPTNFTDYWNFLWKITNKIFMHLAIFFLLEFTYRLLHSNLHNFWPSGILETHILYYFVDNVWEFWRLISGPAPVHSWPIAIRALEIKTLRILICLNSFKQILELIYYQLF